jgi:opacity protein-like surface antigen
MFVFVLAVTSSPEAKAGERFYVSAFGAVSWGTGDADGTNSADNSDISGDDDDFSGFGGAAIGRIFHLSAVDLRLEIEGTGGRAYSFETPGGSGSYLTRDDIWTLQGNFWFDYSLSKIWPDTPFIRSLITFGGGGLGYSHHKIRTSDGNVKGSENRSTLVWQGGFGIAYEASKQIVYDIRYQYADLGGPSVNLEDASGNVGKLDMDYGANEIIVGIRHAF